ncbi:thioesterase II family protein [Kitasatospora xanthocidica]|uniref:thioesterase II family protein n=1 Tax=Kitasatospora xanthocidica TaxID=83382 RepID=UPI0036E87B09
MTQTDTRTRATWLRAHHRAPDAAHRLVCFPHAGGHAGHYFPLSAALAPAVEVLSVQYPGRLDRFAEPRSEDLGALAAPVADLLAAEPHPRLVLFGHSMGALVAFETAKRLQHDHGLPPAALLVSGMQAPSRQHPPRDWEREDVLLDEMRQLAGTAPELLENEELRQLFLPILRSDYRAVTSYPGDHDTVLHCPITALAGDTDPVIPDGLDHWAAHTSAAFTARLLPGDHFYLNGFPPPVTAAIRAALP